MAAGCSNRRGVPGRAELVTEATVKSSFQSPADGMLYLYRSGGRGVRGQLHYSGPILAGQTLVIDPAVNKATLDGEPLEVLLPGGDVLYQAYFRRDPSVRRAVSNAVNASSAETRGSMRESARERDTTRDPRGDGSMMREERPRDSAEPTEPAGAPEGPGAAE